MPLGLDDDDLEASIGMYNFRPRQRTTTTYSIQRQTPAEDSHLSSRTAPSHRRDLSHTQGEEQLEKASPKLSPVDEEQPQSHYIGSPITNIPASPQPKANARNPREGNAITTYYSFQISKDEIQPRKLTHSTSLPPTSPCQPYSSTPTRQHQHMPSRNIWRRQFSWADVFEEELRDIDIRPACRPKARSANKSSQARTFSDLSSTSSSLLQRPKDTQGLWRPKKDAHSHGSTSSATTTKGGIDSEKSAASATLPPRQKEKRSSRFEWLLKQLQGRGSDSVGTASGDQAGST